MKDLKVYWSTSLQDGRKNFGDWLSPILCEAVSGRRVVHARPNKCDLMAQGSILAKAKNHFWNRRIDIWGAGLIEAIAPFNSVHRIHAVRGRNTAQLIRDQQVQVIGDPGLLCEILVPGNIAHQKEAALGVIPHYVDQANTMLREFLSVNPRVKWIDVFSEPLDFIKQVAQCEMVLSSSMHGLITADALGVPNIWIRPSSNVWGGDFKYQDYYSIFNFTDVQPFPLTAATPVSELLAMAANCARPGLSQIKENLAGAFPSSLTATRGF